MPKVSTFPTLYDECKNINITNLKSWGYLKPDTVKSGTIYWSNRHGERIADISISASIIGESPHIRLNYRFEGEAIKYNVSLIKIKSNLSKGDYFYFECPITKKLCRKLYLINGYFLHREAFKGCMYECQQWSKLSRSQIAFFKKAMGDDIEFKPYFKKVYKGQPTKRFLKKQEKDSRFVDRYKSLIDDKEASKKLFGF